MQLSVECKYLPSTCVSTYIAYTPNHTSRYANQLVFILARIYIHTWHHIETQPGKPKRRALSCLVVIRTKLTRGPSQASDVCKGGPKKKQEEDGITEKIPRTFHEVCLRASAQGSML
jgi:hypothetical protein